MRARVILESRANDESRVERGEAREQNRKKSEPVCVCVSVATDESAADVVAAAADHDDDLCLKNSFGKEECLMRL